tara:strand:- start:2013 stop:2396 length:384 start_codon:yes stop_codon:yes gene_type:complete
MRKRKRKHKVHTKERIWCSVCQTTSVISNSDVLDIVCGDCFARQFYKDEMKNQTPKLNFGRGWHLKKKFKAPDGKVYSFGKEITGEKDVRDTKQSSKKTKSISKRSARASKQVLSGKNKRGRKKKQK